jgi:hypothetical protein
MSQIGYRGEQALGKIQAPPRQERGTLQLEGLRQKPYLKLSCFLSMIGGIL